MKCGGHLLLPLYVDLLAFPFAIHAAKIYGAGQLLDIVLP